MLMNENMVLLYNIKKISGSFLSHLVYNFSGSIKKEGAMYIALSDMHKTCLK